MRSSSRAHIHRQRGYVLISVLILAVLYLGLMELMLRDSSQVLRSASRFRSRIIAQSLAEDGVELAACRIVDRGGATIRADSDQGEITAVMKRVGDEAFEITAQAVSSGAASSAASVRVFGRVLGHRIKIDRTVHSQ